MQYAITKLKLKTNAESVLHIYAVRRSYFNMKHLVRTPEQALLYLADCTLATVSDMAMKKSKSKHEFQRQIAIAQSAVDWIKYFNVEVKVGSRVYDVLALPDKKVETWSRSYNCA